MKKIFILSSVLCLAAFLSLSAGASEKGSMAGSHKGSMMGSAKKAVLATAMAMVTGTEKGSTVKGAVVFKEIESGVKVMADFSGVTPPGDHGFHIHQYGGCGNGGKDAGGHYNPYGTPHGLLKDDGHDAAHLGDMGNVTIDDEGSGSLDTFLPGVSISGMNNIAGRAVILHADADDFGQPTGNAGGRIGCGTIAVIKSE